MINLGTKCKDKETNFEGRVTARVEYLYDSPQVLLEGMDATDSPVSYWIAETRAEIIE